MKRSVRRTACIAAAMLGLLSCDRSPLSPPASDFDVAASTGKCWTTKAELATGRNQLGVGAVNGIVYALGGHGRNFAVDTVEAYDPATDTWTLAAPMPTAREWFGTGTVNGVLYAIGGRGGNTGDLSTVEAYDPATGAWTTKAPMPTPRVGTASSSHGISRPASFSKKRPVG